MLCHVTCPHVPGMGVGVFGGQFCYSADHRVTALTFNPILFEIATKPRSVFRALAMLSSLTEPVFLAYKVGIM